MDMKKIAVATLLAVLPPLSIILTIPLASISDHVLHILFFLVIGLFMAGCYAKSSEIITTSVSRKRVTSKSVLFVFPILLLFVSTHAMPCHYMFSSFSVQTIIDHPCSQPIPPTIPIFSLQLVQIGVRKEDSFISIPHIAILLHITGNRSPPIS